MNEFAIQTFALQESCSMWTIILASISLYVIQSASKQSFVKEHMMNHKFYCASKNLNTATSEIQCVHRCLCKDECEVLNYRQRESESSIQENCEVFDVPSHHESCSSTQEGGWKSLLLTVRDSTLDIIFKGTYSTCSIVKNEKS